jgi:hypothetical protein
LSIVRKRLLIDSSASFMAKVWSIDCSIRICRKRVRSEWVWNFREERKKHNRRPKRRAPLTLYIHSSLMIASLVDCLAFFERTELCFEYDGNAFVPKAFWKKYGNARHMQSCYRASLAWSPLRAKAQFLVFFILREWILWLFARMLVGLLLNRDSKVHIQFRLRPMITFVPIAVPNEERCSPHTSILASWLSIILSCMEVISFFLFGEHPATKHANPSWHGTASFGIYVSPWMNTLIVRTRAVMGFKHSLTFVNSRLKFLLLSAPVPTRFWPELTNPPALGRVDFWTGFVSPKYS